MTLLLLSLLSGSAHAATFEVPSTATPDLESAIDAANSNPGPDIIEIEPGTYRVTSRQDISDTLTIRGASAPREIDDEDVVEDTVIYFDMLDVAVNESNPAAILGGGSMFRVEFGQFLRLEDVVLKQAELLCDNGRDDDGDGSTDGADVHCEILGDLGDEDIEALLESVSMRAITARPSSTLQLSRVQVQGWSFGIDGAAVFADLNSNLLVEDCYFVNNLGRYGIDAGLPLGGPTGSSVFVAGRGIVHLRGTASATVTGTRFFTNEISYGGAIFAIGDDSGGTLVRAQLDVTDSVFRQNSSEDGGAIYVESGRLTARRNFFVGNAATLDREDGAPIPPRWEGGDIYAEDSNVTLTNNLFHSSVARDYGNALAFKIENDTISTTTPSLLNNVFYSEGSGGGDGGDVYLKGTGVDFRNNIVQSEGQTTLFGLDIPSTFSPSASIAWNTFSGTAVGDVFSGDLSRTVVNQSTNLFENPQFVYVNADLRLYETWQLRLAFDSPAIDAGDPSMTDVGGSRIDQGLYGGMESGVVDGDGDGWEDVYDCNDDNNAIYPFAPEDCDDLDNNCDGLIDEGVEIVYYRDDDNDGFGEAGSAPYEYCVGDPLVQGVTWVENADDCDDNDPLRNPGLPEICDEIDNNCDGIINNGITPRVFYKDLDGDGFGDPLEAIAGRQSCPPDVSNLSPFPLDCDDGDATVHPLITVEFLDHAPLAGRALEEWETDRDPSYIADFIDQDCDGGDQCYADRDLDGFGEAPSGGIESYINDDDLNCNNGSSTTSIVNTDCDDNDILVYPAALEQPADGVDGNCDGLEICFIDNDEDGFGSTATTTVTEVSCGGVGIASNDLDCDDSNPDANPGQAEICDGFDNDCNGEIDEVLSADAETYYLDADGDGFGVAAAALEACGQPAGYVPARDEGFDCDDDDVRAFPGETEVCDGIDNDCNGFVDGEDAVDRQRFYLDLDGDSYGNEDIFVDACDEPAGYVPNDGRGFDSNDSDPEIGPTPGCPGSSTTGAPTRFAGMLAVLGLLSLRRRRR